MFAGGALPASVALSICGLPDLKVSAANLGATGSGSDVFLSCDVLFLALAGLAEDLLVDDLGVGDARTLGIFGVLGFARRPLAGGPSGAALCGLERVALHNGVRAPDHFVGGKTSLSSFCLKKFLDDALG